LGSFAAILSVSYLSVFEVATPRPLAPRYPR
jgi:hypothetical protein